MSPIPAARLPTRRSPGSVLVVVHRIPLVVPGPHVPGRAGSPPGVAAKQAPCGQSAPRSAPSGQGGDCIGRAAGREPAAGREHL